MSFFRKKLWSIYYILLIAATLALILFSTLFWNQIQKQFIHEQESLTKITANSIESIFLQYETLLDVLGFQLSANNTYNSVHQTQKIFDHILDKKSAVLGFALARPNGVIYAKSSNLTHNLVNNLLEKEETRSTFLKAVASENMVIGRTYFHSTFKNIIVPIRKAIRSNENEVVSVIMSGIDLNRGFDFLKTQLDEYEKDIVLLREYDSFVQFEPHNHNISTYLKKVDKSFLITQLKEFDYDKIKESEKIYSFKYKTLFGDETALFSVKYIKKYELWAVVMAPYSLLYEQFFQIEIIALLIFLITSVLIYQLFKKIYLHEEKKKEQLYHQANFDELTSLYNRTYLSRFEKSLTIKGSKPFSLLFIDIDNFKNINDNYGHDYGDKVLIEASKRLISIASSQDILVRHSGDEFLFITYITDHEELRYLARKIIELLSQPYFIEQYNFMLGASIGIAQFPQDGSSFDEIKRYADFAMYEAKSHKNHYCIFENKIKNNYIKQFEIEQEMKLGLMKKEFYMHYQPQVDSNGNILGVEALVRWHNKNLGVIPPNEFIQIAESIGLMKNLGEFILKTTLMEISELQRLSNKRFKVSINVSVKQFMQKEFYETVLNMIKKFNIPSELITLEITENMFIEDIRYIARLLRKFKKHDIAISLDDFGTGYSSLNILKKLPIDELKIDKSFVDDILRSKEDLHMVEGIVSIAQKLNLDIVAEGIENRQQLECLEQMGCRVYQGYLFAKPMSKSDLLHFLEK
ncbi:EAL domain-containing protein [Candidatus Marinarcus aquaticus]|uniref:Uncharacterized protein n=1 Tax=Candidatus Marinarcus aquaticus TaxID=2044504 RepID=A0A4Q0XVI3_9BACT|nr:EAL domain-containing protein [Candidatus Marinarcus aquaticus]RXJ60219.1 hypothetical protein CRV04_04235 [Candidatus Marinarcus aquaticus]